MARLKIIERRYRARETLDAGLIVFRVPVNELK